MSDATDRILDIIDGGLQSSIEHGFRVDNSPNACIRCLKTEPAEGGDLCRGCRAFLLGDSRVDPKPRVRGACLLHRLRVYSIEPEPIIIPEETPGAIEAIEREVMAAWSEQRDTR
jgi:hypothetical protein